jgi:hypothetical protein
MSKSISKTHQASHSKHHTRKRSFFPYEIAVISSLGPEAVRDQSLVLLRAYNIPADKITIWIQSPGQELIYRSTLQPGSYARIVSVPTQSQSELYNTISQSYCLGTQLVFLSDRITGFYESNTSGDSACKTPLRSLLGLLNTAFAECKQQSCTLWGIQPNHIQTVYRPTVSTSLHTLSSEFWGCINPGPLISLQMNLGAEFERCILFYKRDGAILRLNMIEITVSSSTGNMQQNGLAQAAKRLLERFPNLIHIHPNKSSNDFTIRLKDTSENVQSEEK